MHSNMKTRFSLSLPVPRSNMANWHQLPFLVFSRVAEFLPLSDLISISNVCKSWKLVATKSLKSIRIDASAPFGGSWQKFNADERRDSISDEIEKLAKDLASCTDGIEHLYFNGNLIPESAFTILLSSQKAIKTLQVKYRRRETFDDPRIDLGQAVTQGLIRHEQSLEKINIAIEDVFISFKDLVDGLRDKDDCFPKLMSVEFLFTKFGAYSSYPPNPEDNITEEIKNSSMLFGKIFSKPQIEELNFKPKTMLKLCYDTEAFWNPPFTQLLTKYFKCGLFCNVRKINIDSLNTRGMEGEFSSDDADLLIDNCPHITHFDSDVFYQEINDFRVPVHDDRPLVKIIKHYGPQLVYLHCNINTNIAEHVIQYCPNVESLAIIDNFDGGLADSALISLSGLEKLKIVKMQLSSSFQSPLDVIRFLEKSVSKLTKLELKFQEGSKFDVRILSVIKQNAKSLETLKIDVDCEELEHATETMEGFINVLEGCQRLKSLSLEIDWAEESKTDKWLKYSEEITQLLLRNHSNLRKLHLAIMGIISKQDQHNLVMSMPLCKMVFK